MGGNTIIPILVACLGCLAYLCEAKTIEFKDCGSVAKVKAVSISPCDKEPCSLIRGQNATIGINFVSNRNSNTATNICHGVIHGFPVPFPLEHTNACENQGLVCPLHAGQLYQFHYSLPVAKAYPKISCLVKWEIKGDDNKDMLCVMMNVKLQ